MNKVTRIIKYVISLIALLFCLRYIYEQFQWSEIWQELLKSNVYVLLIGGASLTILYVYVRTIRWCIILFSLDKQRLPLGVLYLSNMLATSFSLVTPMQVGEALKVEVLRKLGYPIPRKIGYRSFVYERSVDLFVLGIIGFYAATRFFPVVIPIFNNVYFWGGVACCLLIIIYILLKMLYDYSLKKGWKLENIPTKVVLLVLFLSLLNWSLVITIWWLMFFGVNILISFHDTTGVMALASWATILSMIPAGLGISEASVTGLLVNLGVDNVKASSAALILRFYMVFFLFIGFFHLLLFKGSRLFKKNNHEDTF